MAALRASFQARVREATDNRRLATALDRWAEFLAMSGRVPFVDPTAAGGDVYNAGTMELFAEYVRQSGSVMPGREGEMLRPDTISDYVSAIRIFRAWEARMEVVPKSAGMLLPLGMKHMRKEHGPPGERKLSRAFRAAHFATLARRGYDRGSRRGVVEWAAALLAHNLLLYGAARSAWRREPTSTRRAT
eukprot:5861211-Pleurochrysis_carterae.AAC.1